MTKNSYRPIDLRMEDGFVLSCEDIAEANWEVSLRLKSGIVICSVEKIWPRIENGRCFFRLAELELVERNIAHLRPDADYIATLYAKNGSYAKSGDENFPFKLSLEQYKLLLGSHRSERAMETKTQPSPKIPEPPRAAPVPQPPPPVLPEKKVTEPEPPTPVATKTPDPSPSKETAPKFLKIRQALCRASKLGKELMFKARAYRRLHRRRSRPRPETRFTMVTARTLPPQKAEAPRVILERMKRTYAIAIAPQPIKVRFVIVISPKLLFTRVERKLLGVGCRSLAVMPRQIKLPWHVIPVFPKPLLEATSLRLLGAGCRWSLIVVPQPVRSSWHVIPQFPKMQPKRMLLLANSRLTNEEDSQQSINQDTERKEEGPMNVETKVTGVKLADNGLALKAVTTPEAPPGTRFIFGLERLDEDKQPSLLVPRSESENPEFDLSPYVDLTKEQAFRGRYGIKDGNPADEFSFELRTKEGKLIIGPRPEPAPSEPPASREAATVPSEAKAPEPAPQMTITPPNVVDYGVIWRCNPMPRIVRAAVFERNATSGEFELKGHIDVEEGKSLIPFKELQGMPRDLAVQIVIQVVDEKDTSKILLESEKLTLHWPAGADKPVAGLPPEKKAPEPVQPTPPPTKPTEPVRPPADPKPSQGTTVQGMEELLAVLRQNASKPQGLNAEELGVVIARALQAHQPASAQTTSAQPQAVTPPAPVTVNVTYPPAPTSGGGQPPPPAGQQTRDPNGQPERRSAETQSPWAGPVGIAACLFILGLTVCGISWIWCHCVHTIAVENKGAATTVLGPDYEKMKLHEEYEQLKANMEMTNRLNSVLADKLDAAITNSGVHMENNKGGIMTGNICISNNTGTININIGSKDVTNGGSKTVRPIVPAPTYVQPQASAQPTGFMPMQSFGPPQTGIQAVYTNPQGCYGYDVPSGPACVGSVGVSAGVALPFPAPPPFDPLSQLVIGAISGDSHDHNHGGHPVNCRQPSYRYCPVVVANNNWGGGGHGGGGSHGGGHH